MQRIDGPGATVDKRFTEGDPIGGIPATTVTDDWLNAVQEEIANAIEGNGIPLDPQSNTQLRGLVAPIATQAEAEAGTENTKRMTPLRVAQAIATKLTSATETVIGMLRVGTQAETDAGTLDDVAVTPKKLRFGFSASLGQNGYVVLPSWLGGLIFQWGYLASVSSTLATQSFNISFPAACRFMAMTPIHNAAYNDAPKLGALPTQATFVIHQSSTSIPLVWFATGN